MFAEKRWTAGKQFKENCSQAINVGGGLQIRGSAACLLWCYIARRAEDSQGPGEVGPGVEPFCQSKATHQGFSASIEENIARLQVAVKDALTVGMLNCTS